ncbi:MAG: sensor histidine kinase, partial [Planctomycetes bacterium]|nr:sensor histidine kinase [Planctomycetota bacterium]
FDMIPLILIDNAVKYSFEEEDIAVSVDDQPARAGVNARSVIVSVISRGVPVPEDMRIEIFKRGVRGPGVEEFASSGSGLGLYIGKTVAEANGFDVRYECYNYDKSKTVAYNKFTFEVPCH